MFRAPSFAPRLGLSAKNLPPNVLHSEYAVRGELVIRAEQISKQLLQQEEKNALNQTNSSFPFAKLIPCNIGNPQAVGAKPLTFHRQVLSVLTSHPSAEMMVGLQQFPDDALQRGWKFRSLNPGAYSHSKGVPLFRQMVADYIDRRDGLDLNKEANRTNTEHLYLTDGASPAVKTAIELMVKDENDVLLIPIPQYPLYSATIARTGGSFVGYEMTEDYDSDKPSWGLDLQNMETLIQQELDKKKRVRAIAVINPGNPTGNVLSRENIEAVLKLAYKYDLVVLADEVYQENVYENVTDKPFLSFRKVLLESEDTQMKEAVQLFSFHSISKGYYGECGLRGGYMHLTNIPEDVHAQIYKLCSMFLCSNTIGQGMIASVLNPPNPSDPSFELFDKEKSTTMSQLKRKAKIVHERLNQMQGMNCMPIEGAMYAFPKVDLPEKFCAEAEKMGKQPDTWYCIQLLEQLGLITVPGNGFGQKANTYHFRTTILPPEEELVPMLDRLERFQEELHEKYK
ncbi:unnamed protein product [Amoebophrya sp. A120]|nr:unnamed protein product [Amoebophrya sp. A120]|eukprot:GSA120T00023662001.1